MDTPGVVDELAKYLYDSIYGDLDDSAGPSDLLYQLGYTDENGEWIYDEE